MASVFLSYARDDAAKAKALAKCLERGGHEVWWDNHIHGGSEYSGEIQAALSRAEVVIVLWSITSVGSAWVRDEAAEGRDNGRLLPLLLDDSAPPLGFRQIQSIPLTGWSGRGNPPNVKDLLAAIAARTKRHESDAGSPGAAPATGWMRRPALIAGALLGAVLLALGAWWFLGTGREGASRAPVVAVMPFNDLSPGGDKAYFAEGVAEAILTVLAKEPGIRIVGRSTAFQLHNAAGDADKMRRALGVTHILEGSARSSGDQLRMSVRLIDAADGKQLWAEEYRRRLDNVFAVQDEIGRAVAQRLKGSFAPGREAQPQATTIDAYNLYLAARAKMRDRRLSSLADALRIARQVIAADPTYAPGHALNAELIWHLSTENYGNIPMERMRVLAGSYARRAIALAPAASEGHAALGVISTGSAAVGSLRTAIRLDPARSELRLWLARAHQRLGNNAEGLEQLEAATEMDPLWAPAIWNHAWALAGAERFDDAETVIARFEQRGGPAAMASRMRGEIAGFYRGDFSEAVKLLRWGMRIDPETPLARENLAWSYEKVGLSKEAAEAGKRLPLYSRLWVSGDHHRLLSQAREDGPKIWQQPDPEFAIEALSLSRDWTTIERIFDGHRAGFQSVCEGFGSWKMQLGIGVAQAMKIRGRSGESARLLGCIQQSLSRQGRGTARSFAMTNGALDVLWAQVHALEGRPQRAFPRLDKAIRGGIRTTYGRGLSEYPAFDAFKTSPDYARIDAHLKRLIAAERAEVLRVPR